jgi:hypothetical protein
VLECKERSRVRFIVVTPMKLQFFNCPCLDTVKSIDLYSLTAFYFLKYLFISISLSLTHHMDGADEFRIDWVSFSEFV